MDATTYYRAAVGAWLVAGLVIEGVLALRQWRHLGALAASGNNPKAAHPDRLVAYGQRRALLQWLSVLAGVMRIGLWLPAGLLMLFYQPFAQAGLPGVALFVGLFAGCDRLLQQILPWARWRWAERRFDMSRMTAGVFLRDAGRTIGLDVVTAALAGLWLLWPFAFWSVGMAWVASAVLLLVGAALRFWARPNLIAPLFNRFSALPAGELRTRLEAMMQRCGSQLDDVLVMDGSRRSSLANAYFTGIGRSKRVVLFDTLIERLEPAELEAVMAHELGHYQCGHLRRYYGLLGALLFMGYAALGVLQFAVEPGLPPPMVLVSVYLLLPALAWPVKPGLATLRRHYEYEADAYAARHASSRALVSALEKLLANNLNAPTMDRWYALFHATHPPGSLRLKRLLACY